MRSILETFFIQFLADTTDLKKGTQDAKKDVDTLNRSLLSTDKISETVGKSFKKLMSQAGKLLIGYFGARAIYQGFTAATQFADKLGELSDALDVNVESLSAWGDAVTMNGGSAEEFQGTVKSMTAALSDFATKGKSRTAIFFQELGIRMVDAKGKARGFIELLPEIASAFEHISKAESLGIGQKLGLDIGTIMLLQKGRREVEDVIKRQKELGVVTKEDAEIAAKFNDTLDDTKHVFRSLYTSIGSYVLPPLIKVLKAFEGFVSFLKEHSVAVKGILIGLGTAIAIFLVPPLVTAATAMIALISPFLAVAAVVGTVGAAIMLLYEDFEKFKNGQNSLIGVIINKWPIVGTVLNDVIKSLKIAREFSIEFLKALLLLFVSPIKAIEIFKKALMNAFNEIRSSFPLLEPYFKSIEFIFNSIAKALDAISSGYSKVKSLFGSGDANTQKLMIEANHKMNTASASPFNSQSTNSILNSSKSLTRHTSVQTGDININTQATDAQGIASEVGKSMTSEINKAIDMYSDGVAA